MAIRYAEELGYSQMSVERVLGYGAHVCLLCDKQEQKMVVKINKEFQPYPNLPLYPKNRVKAEAAMYSFLTSIDNKYVPRVVGMDVEKGLLAIDHVGGSHVVFDDLLLSGYVPSQRFMESFVTFLRKKASKNAMGLENSLFYTQKTTKELRSLFVPKKYTSTIERLFSEAERAGQVANCSGLSPKNIFVSPTEDTFKLIDFEEAFIGDEVYDPAYFASHLLLYALATKNPEVRNRVAEFSERAFSELSYSDGDITRYARYVGLMLLHRAEGFNLKGIPPNVEEVKEIGDKLLTEKAGKEIILKRSIIT